MLIKSNLKLHQVIAITWKVDLVMLLLCTAAHFTDVHLVPEIDIPGLLPSLIGTALAFFIGFNNNHSYGRWWEARMIWGALVNDCRSWARFLLAYASVPEGMTKEEVDAMLEKMVRRQIAFVHALKTSLQKSNNKEYEHYLTQEELNEVKMYSNIPNAILDKQSEDLQKLTELGIIDQFRFLALNQMIVNFCDHMGKSERIKNTVFPPTYSFFTRMTIWIFVVLVTMSSADSIDWWSIPLGWVMGFVFHVTHMNGMSLVNPFELIPQSIPLQAISRTIEINLLEMIGAKEIPEPVKPINDEYVP